MELVSRSTAVRGGGQLYPMPVPMCCRMANDTINTITEFTVVRVTVGEVEAEVYAFVGAEGASFDLLLGKIWLMGVQAVENHHTRELTITAQDGFQSVVPLRSDGQIHNPIKSFGLREYLHDVGADTTRSSIMDAQNFSIDDDDDEDEDEGLSDLFANGCSWE